ncbi:hypothetical protein [Paludifilum halophilum]|uniref:Uncharacterized protein n=1 Tax=Paludifilum halophilum TaxID=1642702 RepID=A0A235BAH4_9BACL|nr:hypothetical protein [Paludifilum halophilum]OYD08989.1 hypothetical protein CHM34_04235 [Paludifilum halophilum]
MKQALDSWKIELRLLSRNYWSWIVLILTGIYIIFGFPEFLLQYDPGRTLMGSAYVVVGGILIFLIYGWSLIHKEKESQIEEVIESLPHGIRGKILGKGLALVSVVALSMSYSMILVFYRFYKADVLSIFWVKAVPYLLLYWGLPFLVAGLLGMVIRLSISSKLSYLLILVVWILFSPLISILSDMNHSTPFISDWISKLQTFNLGQSDIHTPYDPVYGLPMEIYRWMKVLFWLLVSVFLLCLRYLQKTHHSLFPTQGWYVSAGFLVLILPVLYLWNLPDQPRFEQGNRVTEDYRQYYGDHPKIHFKNGVPFTIHSY